MSEELDYMSDEFISKCANTDRDVRPGLLKTHNEQRQHNLLKKKKSEEEKRKPNETEILEESLKQPINSTNKGFSMLEKMGFKSGQGLGKNNTGTIEPININIKNNRRGFGFAKPTKLPKPSSNLEKINESDYRAFLSKKNKEREIASDLRKSQRMCWELDSKCGKTEPDELWFWPDDEPETTEDSEQVEIEDSEKLEELTKYLREKYYYCIWCKVQYEDEKDMGDCPGATRDEH